ncbi:MAG TPA: DNA gyrase C-terminal beta-propeller domain-containing protein [Nitrospiraceae bacterium]
MNDLREIGRNTQGVRVLDLEGDDDRVVGVACIAEREEEPPENGNGEHK